MIYKVENIHSLRDRQRCGGKGLNLFYLTQAGMPVPSWFITPFDFDMEKNVHEIEAAFNELKRNTSFVAVRSSASIEDREDLSFAGQFETYLFIKNKEELVSAIQRIRGSAKSERVLEYLRTHGVEKKTIEVAVIVQAMIDSEISGVMFTANPMTGNSNEIFVNAAWGLGSLIVGGGSADTYVLAKESHSITQKKIAKKEFKEVLNEADGSGITRINVSNHLQNTEALNQKLLSNLATLALKIENLFKIPQDIEWAIKDHKIFILQSRPITTLQFGEEKLWDNSNIAESYSGITLPLTASFARYVYEIVYREVAQTSGVPKKIVDSNKRIFENMLGFFKGRLYYNLYNWYRLLSFFPAFTFTKDSMEKMMSMKESRDFTERIKMPRFFKLWYTIRAFYRYLTFNKELNFFKRNFETTYNDLIHNDLGQMSEEQLIKLFYRVESRILHTWHTPIDNDFLVMLFYGLLRRLVGIWGLEKDTPAIYNDLLSGTHGVASVEQTEELIMLSQKIKANSDLRKLFELDKAEHVWGKIWSGNLDQEFAEALHRYFERFGSRFTNELKLEEPSIDEQPEKFISLIKMYLSLPEEKRSSVGKDHDQIKQEAEETVKEKLNVMQRIILSQILKKTKQYLKNREEMRLMRAKIFGFVRDVFKNIGKKLQTRKIIDASDDIFYLELDEVIHYLEGSAAASDLKSLVDIRKKEFHGYKADVLQSRFITQGISYLNLPLTKGPISSDSSDLELKGSPCSPGRAEGKVAVMENVSYTIPDEAKILVARHTDPGWTTIFSRFDGIVVEYGGQLSHAAIVSRELGIPCVVGVENIMQLVRDGDYMQLDGSRGELLVKKA